MTPTLRLLGRPGCGLCEEMHAELAMRFAPPQLTLEIADVDSRADWREAYGLRIPVLLTPAGEALCSVHLDVEAVETFLRDAAMSPSAR